MDRTKLRNLIAGCHVEKDGMPDNLAIALCSYFEDHLGRPDDDDPASDETGWGAWVSQKYEEAMDLITDEVLRAIEAETAEANARWIARIESVGREGGRSDG